MKLLCFFVALVICLSVSVASAQTGKEHAVPLFFEKAYLHTDREVYSQTEDIWYKAYVVNAQNNVPINYSHNLYVELINPDAKVVRREMIRLEDGLGNGDFKISDTIPAGHYRLRAYTNWMRNFGDNFVFEKNIIILQTSETSSSAMVASNKKPPVKNTVSASIVTAPLPVIRFFPEGGSLVNGISSIVGVKAEDANGKGIPVQGAVISSIGDTVAHFTCDSLGLGVLALFPIAGQSYHSVANQIGSFELPAALSKGLTLQVKQTDTLIHALINRSGGLAEPATLVVKHAGKTQLSKQLALQNPQTAVKIPTASLPEGISVITIYDAQNKPECERLVYIHPNSQNKFSVITDQKSYQPKGQVSVTIHTEPDSHLSMAVVDAATVPVQSENILSYFNLQSEIKGSIEQPNRYFDTTNVNRFKQLDMLLLTQGWRDFVWKRMEDTTLKIAYEPEQGINITGKVKKVWAKAGLSGINVTMHAPKAEGQKLYWAETDSAGQFAIYNTQFYGYQYISFTSRRSDKINQDGESKGFSSGALQVDSLWQDTLATTQLPMHMNKPVNLLPASQDAEIIERLRKKLGLKAERNLKEVTIKGTKSRLFTQLPTTRHSITRVEQKEYDNLAQYLLYMIPGSNLQFDGCTYCTPAGGGRPDARNLYVGRMKVLIRGYYLDNSKINYCYVCQDDYLSLPMSSILKVNIFSNESVGGLSVSISLALRPGALETKDFFDNTMADMVGYYKAREFYKPKVEKPNDIDPRTNTIHWEPNITTNEKGEATVTFYNTAQTGKMRLITEGITPNGTPLVATSMYEVR